MAAPRRPALALAAACLALAGAALARELLVRSARAAYE